MLLKLSRPLCFFDLETTGTQVVRDRIVEMAVVKVHPDGEVERKRWLINPEMPIPAEVSAIHGITDEMVANAPTFKQLSGEINQFLLGCDLAGYNSNKFDIPLLAEEFLRAGMDFDMTKRKAVDVQNIFHRMEQRTLSAAYRFYCNKELDGAHSALVDTDATYEVLMAQLDRYRELENDVSFLAEFSNRSNAADMAGFIVYNNQGEEVFTFGKYKGEKVESILERDPGYYSWIQQADFPLYTKKVLTAIKLRSFNK